MANIKDLKKKIKSTKATLKITTAMKLVSAAKLAKAQIAIMGARPYSEELENTIKVVSALIQNYFHPFLQESPKNKHSFLLVISSNRGLCGGYNSQLVKKVSEFIGSNYSHFKILNIGKKARDLMKRKKKFNLGTHYELEGSEPSFAEIKAIGNELGQMFYQKEIGRVFVVYNKFFSAINFTPMVKQVLPLTLPQHEKEELRKKHPFDFKYDTSPKDILDSLIPEAYLSSLYTCLLDGLASEHGSRMASMDNASKNCKEIIRSQTLTMNKLRQAAITTELIEVVSGAEALNG